MEKLWFHVGMPKAGSTAIQYYLSRSFERYEQRYFSYDNAYTAVNSPVEMNEILKGLSADEQPPNSYSPRSIKVGKYCLVSSENLSYFNADKLQGLNASGIAVIREPAAWVTSMATQDLLLSIPHNFKDDEEHFKIGTATPEEQLIELIGSYSEKYIEILNNIDSWSNALTDFRLLPYSSDGGMIAEIADDLAKIGVICNKSIEVGQVRASYDFKLAQIGFSIYLAARFLFKCSRTQSCKLTSLALSIDALIYKDQFSDISPSVAEKIKERLNNAHERYAEIMHLNGNKNQIKPLQIAKLQVLGEAYSNSLVDTLISAKLGFSQVPDGFDAGSYLSLNPEIDVSDATKNRFAIAINHYRRIGFKEARPVPKNR